ncbi:nucleoside deaminase [Agreia sp. COWG]|uniref:nucleoside deaminase n=1 Tax=Agreia sp. COWG TaxID=2773266 RepID=UPI001926B2D9|nr:nucleoside deaminase [Agreia sp. COWG]CAD5993925.1 Cytosine deaminase [Agreia sp. COWG]
MIYATDQQKLAVARAEAEKGAKDGGIPIGAALFTSDGVLLGSGHNRRVQDGDAAMHAETNAFHNAGRQRSYRNTVMVTTLSPCWYCSGLVRQFGIGRVVVGDDQNFLGGQEWVAEHGCDVTVLNDSGLIAMMAAFIENNPALWNEDIGEE